MPDGGIDDKDKGINDKHTTIHNNGYSSSHSYRSRGKGGGKGSSSSSSSKSSKKLSKRSGGPYGYDFPPLATFSEQPTAKLSYLTLPSPLPYSENPSRRPSSRPSPPRPSQVQVPSAILRSSQSPSGVPIGVPTVVPIGVPIVQKSLFASRAPPNSTCQWTACGEPISNQCTGSSMENSGHVRLGGLEDGRQISVRCCSDTELPNFRRFGNDDSCPFAESEVNGECFRGVPYSEAVFRCASVGARLCTKDELERRCTSGSGCGYNTHPVWSSTSAVEGFFDAGENSYKQVVTAPGGQVDTLNESFRCRIDATTDLGILVFNEDECQATCRIIPDFQDFCALHPRDVFSFSIPGPFSTDARLYIGNIAEGSNLECEEQLTLVSTRESMDPLTVNNTLSGAFP